MSVLIVTEPDDLHAVLVKLALKEKNIACDLFFSADIPSKQENSVKINENELRWTSSFMEDGMTDITSKSYSTIWWRRPRQPFIPDYAHADDVKFINKENYAFFQSIPHFLADNIWWVNPVSSFNKIKSKAYQLKLARECGFNLPNTLISNSPDDIKYFIGEADETPVIYKSFTPHTWYDHRGFNTSYTQKIQLNDFISNKMIKIVPGIYQHYVEKLYELRITCFGSYVSAIKIDSQKNDISKIDWRKSSEYDLKLTEVEIPNQIKQLIALYMKKMEIVFGCFDFIVTPNEEYIFLEVNEQGQFLWVEDVLPQTNYLDVFCSYLVNKSFEFNWAPNNEMIRCSDFDNEAKEIVSNNILKHVHLNEIRRTK
jgi:glutathione synthase/RimK-type ligase-like ATP-grasp enzyme